MKAGRVAVHGNRSGMSEVRTMVRLLQLSILAAFAVPALSQATLLHNPIYPNPAPNLWRYSYDAGPNPNVTSAAAYATSTSQYSGAVFQGYVQGRNLNPAGPFLVDLWEGGDMNVGAVRTFGTYIISSTNQVIHLQMEGDDGHSAFVDGQFVAGGGFSVAVPVTLNLVANTPVFLEVVGYNYTGPSVWAIGTCSDVCNGSNWTAAIDDLPGITITPVLPVTPAAAVPTLYPELLILLTGLVVAAQAVSRRPRRRT